jgi:hypothetical protein
VGRRL